MLLKDVAVTSLNFASGLKGPIIKALAIFIFEEVAKPQFG
jgi:hypothetical protein